MVYIDTTRCSNFITNSGIEAKHPSIKCHKSTTSLFIMYKFQRCSVYQRLARRFFSQCRKFTHTTGPTTQSLSDFLSHYCTGEMKMFCVYAKHHLDEFECCKYLETFCGKSITQLVACMNDFNMINDIPYNIRNNQTIFDDIKKILTTHMIFSMAKTCAIIETAIKSGTMDLLHTIYLSSMGYRTSSEHKEVMDCTTKYLKNGGDITKDINDTDSELIKTLSSSIGSSLNRSKFILQLYENNKKLYYYFISKSSQEIINKCAENPDMDAMVGMYFYSGRKITKESVIKFLVKVDNYLLISLLGDEMVGNEDTGQIKNLVMPVSKINQSRIVIEI